MSTNEPIGQQRLEAAQQRQRQRQRAELRQQTIESAERQGFNLRPSDVKIQTQGNQLQANIKQKAIDRQRQKQIEQLKTKARTKGAIAREAQEIKQETGAETVQITTSPSGDVTILPGTKAQPKGEPRTIKASEIKQKATRIGVTTRQTGDETTVTPNVGRPPDKQDPIDRVKIPGTDKELGQTLDKISGKSFRAAQPGAQILAAGSPLSIAERAVTGQPIITDQQTREATEGPIEGGLEDVLGGVGGGFGSLVPATASFGVKAFESGRFLTTQESKIPRSERVGFVTRQTTTAAREAGEFAVENPAKAVGTGAGAFVGGAALGAGTQAGISRTAGAVTKARRTKLPASDLTSLGVLKGDVDFPMFSRKAVPGDEIRAITDKIPTAKNPVAEIKARAEALPEPLKQAKPATTKATSTLIHATGESRAFGRRLLSPTKRFRSKGSPRPNEPAAMFFSPELSTNFLRIGGGALSSSLSSLKALRPRLPSLSRPKAVVSELEVTQAPRNIATKAEMESFLSSQIGAGKAFVRSEKRISPELEVLVPENTLFARTSKKFYTEIDGTVVPIDKFKTVTQRQIEKATGKKGKAAQKRFEEITGTEVTSSVPRSRAGSKPGTPFVPVTPGASIGKGKSKASKTNRDTSRISSRLSSDITSMFTSRTTSKSRGTTSPTTATTRTTSRPSRPTRTVSQSISSALSQAVSQPSRGVSQPSSPARQPTSPINQPSTPSTPPITPGIPGITTPRRTRDQATKRKDKGRFRLGFDERRFEFSLPDVEDLVI